MLGLLLPVRVLQDAVVLTQFPLHILTKQTQLFQQVKRNLSSIIIVYLVLRLSSFTSISPSSHHAASMSDMRVRYYLPALYHRV